MILLMQYFDHCLRQAGTIAIPAVMLEADPSSHLQGLLNGHLDFQQIPGPQPTSAVSEAVCPSWWPLLRT